MVVMQEHGASIVRTKIYMLMAYQSSCVVAYIDLWSALIIMPYPQCVGIQ